MRLKGLLAIVIFALILMTANSISAEVQESDAMNEILQGQAQNSAITNNNDNSSVISTNNQNDNSNQNQSSNNEFMQRVNQSMGEEGPISGMADGEEIGSVTGMFFKTILIILVLAAIIYFVFRFISKRKNVVLKDSDLIRVLGTSSIALGKYIQIVEISGKIYILGIGEGTVSLITEISDKEEIDKIKLSADKDVSNMTRSFKDYVGDLIGKFQAKPGIVSTPKSGSSGQNSFAGLFGNTNLQFIKNKTSKLKNI